MKPRVYLFCNREYGRPFFHAFREFAAAHAAFDCRAVLSAKGLPRGRLRRALRFVRQTLRGDIALEWGAAALDPRVKMNEIENVNAPDFVASVPSGSIGFVAGFNQIFRPPLIGRFSSFVNFHPSLLPYYRGAIPSYWVLRNRETVSGYSAHVVAEQVDAGEILFQEEVPVDAGMSEEDLDARIAAAAAVYFGECLACVAAGQPFRRGVIEPGYLHRVGYVPSRREEEK